MDELAEHMGYQYYIDCWNEQDDIDSIWIGTDSSTIWEYDNFFGSILGE